MSKWLIDIFEYNYLKWLSVVFESSCPYLPFLVFAFVIIILNNFHSIPNPRWTHIQKLSTEGFDFVHIFAASNQLPKLIFFVVSGIHVNLDFVIFGRIWNLEGKTSSNAHNMVLISIGFLNIKMLIRSAVVIPNCNVALLQLFIRIINSRHIQRFLILFSRHNFILDERVRKYVFSYRLLFFLFRQCELLTSVVRLLLRLDVLGFKASVWCPLSILGLFKVGCRLH